MMKKKQITLNDVFEAINNGFTNMESRMATKEDLERMEQKIRLDMATKEDLKDLSTRDDIKDLERKLIEDTGVITSVENKHNDALGQRVLKLEKHVFKTS